MSDLKIKDIKPKEAEQKNFEGYDISLKRDGTLIYFIDGKLFSPRCERTERFKHIANALSNANFPNCMGEMYIEGKGTNVFDVSKSENWAKAKFMPFDLIDSKNYEPNPYDMTFTDRKELLKSLVVEMDSEFITETIDFDNYESGWNYVLENESEGLVIRNNVNWFKVKILKEIDIEIVEHEVGSSKGTFILKNGSRISGTSEQFVLQFANIKQRGNKAIAEVEYAFTTDSGKLFQPRLRQILEK